MRAGDADIIEVESKLSSAKKSVAELAERQVDLEAKLASFAESNVPELLLSANPKLTKRLLYTGLVRSHDIVSKSQTSELVYYYFFEMQVVDRRLSDYEQLEVLHGARHHVLLVKYNNRVAVLKVCLVSYYYYSYKAYSLR